MGYRSEVAIAFYTHEPEHNGVVSLWLKSNFPYDDWGLVDRTITEKDKPVYSFVFHVVDVKWYDGYPAVERMHKLIKDFDALFCVGANDIAACEFMCSGENYDDVEYDTYGETDGVLELSKHIEVNL